MYDLAKSLLIACFCMLFIQSHASAANVDTAQRQVRKHTLLRRACRGPVRHSEQKRFDYGGDSAIGSGETRVADRGRVESCAPNGKWITSFTAIVAPQLCTLVRGALVLEHWRVPLTQMFFPTFFFLRPWPSRKCSLLYFLIFTMSFAVQRQCLPPFIPISSDAETFPSPCHRSSVTQ